MTTERTSKSKGHAMKQSFKQVADFCERHLEATRGREIGMTLGAAINALGRIAAHPGDEDDTERRQLNERADELLLEFSKRFIVDYGWVGDDKIKPVEPTSMRTNMIYDPGMSDEQ
jgi:hypothetical protein